MRARILATAGVLTGASTLLLGAAAALPAAAAPVAAAAPTSCPPRDMDQDPRANDINGDGVADTVIGGKGYVDVRYGGPVASVRVDAAQVPGGTASFGASVAYGDVDNDGCADVIVGQPGSDRVVVVYGPVAGGAPRTLVITPPQASRGDEFGAAVAVGFAGDYTDPRAADIWVGAPGRTVRGQRDAGVLYHYVVGTDGTVTLLQQLSEASPAVPGAPHAGDRFGGVLSANTDGVAVGLPDKTVDDHPDAGAIDVLVTSGSTGRLIKAQAFSQHSAGVGGSVRTGNRFGAAVAGGGQAVGAPNAPVGSARNAGTVQTFHAHGVSGTTSYRLTPLRYYSQNSPGVPGAAEAGNRFGESVAVGTFTCQEAIQVAVGAPGENIDGVVNAGTVTILTSANNGNPAGGCPRRVVYQGHGIGGPLRAGAGTGTRLSLIAGDSEEDEDAVDRVVIAAPGTSVHGVADAGAGYEWFPQFGRTSSTYRTMTATGSVHAGDRDARYGAVLPPP